MALTELEALELSIVDELELGVKTQWDTLARDHRVAHYIREIEKRASMAEKLMSDAQSERDGILSSGGDVPSSSSPSPSDGADLFVPALG